GSLKNQRPARKADAVDDVVVAKAMAMGDSSRQLAQQPKLRANHPCRPKRPRQALSTALPRLRLPTLLLHHRRFRRSPVLLQLQNHRRREPANASVAANADVTVINSIVQPRTQRLSQAAIRVNHMFAPRLSS